MNLFNVVSPNRYFIPPQGAIDIAFLVPDNWDDFGQFATWFDLWYVDSLGKDFKIGGTKIAQYGMGQGHRATEASEGYVMRSPSLPNNFLALDPEIFFSVGQDNSYYENLKRLSEDMRNLILIGLCDLAYNPKSLELALSETVTTRSLLRSVTKETVRGQYARLAQGLHKDFSYGFTYREEHLTSKFDLAFEVRPGMKPPTNMHVLIGQNGVGKSTLLQGMINALIDQKNSPADGAHFTFEAVDNDQLREFSQLVSVAFSAFDPFLPHQEKQKDDAIKYDYVGLMSIDNVGKFSVKAPIDLANDFWNSLRICARGERAKRWRKIVSTLHENFFSETRIDELFIWSENMGPFEFDLETHCTDIFMELSSGHKIVLLTLTRLIETVAESTIILIDEPETHLHPPFLSSYLRAITELVNERNGVAIVATHSPVVLQEVPRNCTWRLVRFGNQKQAFRPKIETFGENVGILTNDIFALETASSGYKKLIHDSLNESSTYESVIQDFKNQIGAEGRAFVRACIPNKKK